MLMANYIFYKLNCSEDHPQIMFVQPKEPIRSVKMLVASPSQEHKAEAKQLHLWEKAKAMGRLCEEYLFQIIKLMLATVFL